MTVPETVQNFLSPKPSKPASHNHKQGTECPFIHQEPHTEQRLLYLGLHRSNEFYCHGEKHQILLLSL